MMMTIDHFDNLSRGSKEDMGSTNNDLYKTRLIEYRHSINLYFLGGGNYYIINALKINYCSHRNQSKHSIHQIEDITRVEVAKT